MKIRNIIINRMPGFPKGLKEFDQLANNVNIIAGPNGSGKSSTARAIQKLLWWKNRTTGYEVDATIEVDNDCNQIHLDAHSYSRVDSHGKTHEDFSFVSPEEFSGQYMLALHDLVHDSDDNLAGIIAKEVSGGIDLNEANSKLDYKFSIPTSAHPAYREYNTYKEEYQKLKKEQALLYKDEETIEGLENERKQSEKAAKLVDLYEKTLKLFKEKEKYRTNKALFDSFPPVMSKLKEDDFGKIEATEKQLAEIDAIVAEAENIREESMLKISRLHIYDKELNDIQVDEVGDRIEKLKTLNQQILQLDKEIRNQKIVKEQAAKVFTGYEELNDLRQLNLKETFDLSEFIRVANETMANKNKLESEKKRLENELNGEDNTKKSIESYQKGIIILSDWLKGVTTKEGQSDLLIWSVPVVGVVAALLSFFFGYIGLINSLLMALLLIPVILSNKRKNANSKEKELNIRISDYLQTGLPLPGNWDSPSVAEKIDELLNEVTTILHQKKIKERIGQLIEEIELIETQYQIILSEYTQLKVQIGVLPDTIDSLVVNYNSFYVFLQNLLKWQEAKINLQQLTEEMEVLRKSFQEEMNKINSEYVKLGFGLALDLSQVIATFQTIQKERGLNNDLLNAINTQKRIIQLKLKEKENYQQTLLEIYNRLELPVDHKHEVYVLANNMAEYRKAKSLLNESLAQVKANEELLLLHPLYEDYKEQLAVTTIDEIDKKMEEYSYLANKQRGIIEKISDINAQIKEKKSKNDIELALSGKDKAYNDLNISFLNYTRSMTGSLITEHLQQEISLNNDNRVFKQANNILGGITKGRYKLILSEGKQPVFMAYDNIANCVQPLKEISTGTRVQLLLAIRLAYIESQENVIKLPILADELLANSDDERSEAIIRALIEISRNRQLFYFTAQADEIQKWQHYLDMDTSIDSTINILGTKTATYKKPEASVSSITLLHEVPLPNGMTHAEYGKALNVGPFNLIEQSVSELHLWYLMEDVTVLCHVLRAGIVQWGQLSSFLDNAGTLQGVDKQYIKVLNDRISLLISFKELYSYGRPKEINKEVLIDSKAVTDKFLDETTALLVSVNNNPDELLNALNSGAVKGFLDKKKKELRAYLLEKNYISDAKPYTDEELRIKTIALVSTLGIEHLEAENFINRFLQ